MYIFLSIIIVIASVLLIGAVLIQKSKGGGLASDYSSGNQYMGYRKTTDFIEKATWTLAILILVFSVCSAYTLPKAGSDIRATNIAPEATEEAAPAEATPAAAPAPAAQAAEAAEAAAPAPAAEAPAAPATPAPAAEK